MGNREFDKLDKLIRAKDFEVLTAGELTFVEEHMGSKQAYDNLRLLVLRVQESTSRPVDAAVMRDLMGEFKVKHQKLV